MFENLKKAEKPMLAGNGKQTISANVIFTSELLKKTASENHVSTGGFLSSLPVLMLFPLAGY